ncbi:MAG: gamma-glutamylcyclotransferase family protein [Janthinobacterium lividum]
MKPGLFVYGTLHPDRAPEEIRDVVRQMTLVGDGTISGEVHDLGEYPALAPRGQRKPVRGSLFALPDHPDALRKLDAYEEFNPQQPETSLFRRRRRVVTLSDGRKERHWVYVYNRELPAAS